MLIALAISTISEEEKRFRQQNLKYSQSCQFPGQCQRTHSRVIAYLDKKIGPLRYIIPALANKSITLETHQPSSLASYVWVYLQEHAVDFSKTFNTD